MASRYPFTEYSPDWPLQFLREAAQIEELLGDELVRVHHIGSTSVPGLAAKPIIDLLPVVQNVARVDERSERFVAAGYRSWGEYGLPGRRLFTRDRDDIRIVNVHVYAVDNPDVQRHVAFCAYLKNFREVREEYEALKRDAYARHPNDIDGYCDAKDLWIKRLEPMAIGWHRRQARR